MLHILNAAHNENFWDCETLDVAIMCPKYIEFYIFDINMMELLFILKFII